MVEETGRKVIVIGHRNPDTDSICSAIGLREAQAGGDGRGAYPVQGGGGEPRRPNTCWISSMCPFPS